MNLTKKLAVAATLLVVLAIVDITVTPKTHKSDSSKAEATVMVTNLSENSGGTGTVLSSNSSESIVLTNRHVCELAKRGSIVQNEKHSGFVTSFYQSQVHDLCILKVATDFKISTRVAKESPKAFSEGSVSGHPHLLPTLITRGSFSGKRVVQIMTGLRPCTPDDDKDPQLAFICALVGGVPLIRTYEAQVVGATIQAGNSGSAIYNEAGEIAAVVFAGSGDIGYALAVPYEYINNFLNDEIANAHFEKPNTLLGLDQMTNAKAVIKSSCFKYFMGDIKMAPIAKFCNSNTNDLIYNK